MPVVSTETNVDALTMSVVAEWDASQQRAWQLFADPRQLERWWGPPEWPATFFRHDFTAGGKCAYFMTGPDGTKMYGWWKFLALEEPSRLEVEDGFADDNGEPTGQLGTSRMAVSIESSGSGSRMTLVSTFESADQLAEMIAMGMEEGMGQALGQIDAILAI